MALTINDARDAAHSAYMDMNTWAQEFVAEWMAPIIAMQEAKMVEEVILAFESMPAELRKAMETQSPEQYAEIMARVDEMKARKK